MDTTKDKKTLEQELIKEFIQNFYEKIGYYPLVILKDGKNSSELGMLTLNELETHFTALLPRLYNEKLTLSHKSRTRAIVELRSIFSFIARSMGYTYREIGVHLGGRDHTTAIHSVTTFKNLYETEEGFRSQYFTIINNINNKYEPSIVEHIDQMEIES